MKKVFFKFPSLVIVDMCDQDVSPQWMPTHKVTWSFGHVILQDMMVIYIKRVPMATKLGRMMTYLNELLPLKSHDTLITWTCEIT